jgi:hypothetical protein
MHHTAALTIAIALASGVIVQALAFHLRIPGIVLLLGTGFLLGPQFLNVVRPALLDVGLLTLVGFAVAVILFEGGMNLRLSRLRREQVIMLCERELLAVERWQFQRRKEKGPETRDIRDGGEPDRSPMFLPLLVQRSRRRFVVDDRWTPRVRDEVWVAMVNERLSEARARLESIGWQRRPALDRPHAVAVGQAGSGH